MRATLEELREKIGTIRPDCGTFVTNSPLDRLLPEGRFRRGSLVQWNGGSTLALLTAKAALRDSGVIVIVDAGHRFYPPAAARLGIDLARVVIARPDCVDRNCADQDWMTHQALCCPAVDAVLCWPERVNSGLCRRWQLAAEKGGSVGMLIGPAAKQRGTGWAELQFAVTGVDDGGGRRQRVEILKGRTTGRWIEINSGMKESKEGKIHDRLHLVSQLADSAAVS
ncbi:MAG: hypothetical protein SGJ20_00595 [Planctomycetota bacterium]|nr:hypothetical protein [Planctomycetota bacterium]